MFSKENLIEECGDYLPEKEREILWESFKDSPVTSVRLHPLKFKGLIFPVKTSVPWCWDGIYLNERPVFTLDPAFHTGAYYVQEASSMMAGEMVGELVKNIKNPVIFDAASAPGGKATHILEKLNGCGVLVCNEPDGKRFNALKGNLAKSGYGNRILTKYLLEKKMNPFPLFDIILLDAPCSGSGMFRKDREWMTKWKKEWPKIFSNLQKKIISNLIHFLRPQGFFIYSTCSFSVSENEENAKFLHDSGMELIHKKYITKYESDGILINDWGCRFYPHRLSGEGFFITVAQKSTADFKNAENFKSDYVEKFKFFKPDIYVRNYKKNEKEYFYLNKDSLDTIKGLSQTGIRVMEAGLKMGTEKFGSFYPSQELAMANHIPDEILKFSNLEVPSDEALFVLKNKHVKSDLIKEAINPARFIRLTYQNNGLAWVEVQNNGKYRVFLDEFHRIKSHKLEG
jgi:16S rRNA C967 or C1407 C5-methylase (RsmB/RsmF family)